MEIFVALKDITVYGMRGRDAGDSWEGAFKEPDETMVSLGYPSFERKVNTHRK